MDGSGYLGDAPSKWSIYFGTDDTDASVAKLLELGGSVLTPSQDTPFGRIAEIADPTGASFRLVQPTA